LAAGAAKKSLLLKRTLGKKTAREQNCQMTEDLDEDDEVSKIDKSKKLIYLLYTSITAVDL